MGFFKRGELKLLWPFYLDSLLSTMLFFVPIFFIVYFRELNFSMFQISILLAIPNLCSLIFEIPTGAIADLYGRKFSVLLGIILQAIAVLALYYVNDFYSISIALAFLGFSSSFVSGASDAWVTDLVNEKHKPILTSFFSKSQSISSAGLVVSGLIGAFLVREFSTKIIWPTAAFSFFLSFIILRFAKENYSPKKSNVRNAFKEVVKQTKTSLKYSIKEKHIFYMMLASVFILIAFTPLDLGFTPLLQEYDFPQHAFGYLWSGISLVGVIAPLITNKILKHGKERKFILITTILMIAITLLIIFAINLTVALAVIISLIFFSRMRSPILLSYFQQFLPTKLRATIGSVKSMSLELTAIIITPLAGFLIDKLGPKIMIFLGSFFAIPAIILYYRIKDEKKVKKGIVVPHRHERKIHLLHTRH